MKKSVHVLLILMLGMSMAIAKPVTPKSAKNIAEVFYKQHSAKVPTTLTLVFTETDSNGEALYYVFNVNQNDGFVIVTADDVMHPIIGYSTERSYKIPEGASQISYWMKNRKKEISSIKAQNLQPTQDIIREWAGDFSANHNIAQRSNVVNSVLSASVAPLVQSTWNQSPYYNKLCPGTGSNQAVTGCVATTMAQIMRYWSYPAQGIGSSSYCDCTSGGYSVQNGTLTANYGATTYSWTSMPLPDANVTSSNCTAIATLMYQCGVSVDMDYSPNGSGSYVLSVDVGGTTNPVTSPCAQNSYVSYFGYNSSTIHGYQRTEGAYSDNAWLNLIETDLNAGRPVQYVGVDPSEGGHTWVCDGYDASNNVHMNWGWGGYDDGFFSINNLLTTNGGFNPSEEHEILVGIQPPSSVDAGVLNVIKPNGVVCATTFTPVVTIQNYGVNTLTACTIQYKIDAGTTMNYNWSGSLGTSQTTTVALPSVTTTAGSHTLTTSTSNPNSTTDANTANDQSTSTFVVNATGATLPLVEGFESNSSLPAGWSIANPDGDAAWAVVTTVAHTGSNCIGFDNCDGNGNGDMTGTQDWLYTSTYNFSTASTATLSFDVGYLPASDGSQVYPDTLTVYYSIDCGNTWNQVYKKYGTTLATGPTFTISSSLNCVAPTSSQWRTDVVNLSAVVGHSNVQFAFKNGSDWGNWIYLDNINIAATSLATGISSVNTGTETLVYPNPAHNALTVHSQDEMNTISVSDVIGQTVIAEQKVSGNEHLIDISSLADGVYWIKVNSVTNQTKVIRFIKN